jgi:glycosyltransferase involved in cell wall biosynthesis
MNWDHTDHKSPGEGLRVLALSDHLGHNNGRLHGGTTYFTTVFPELVRSGIELTACFMSKWHPAEKMLTIKNVDTIFLSKHKYNPFVSSEIRKIITEKKIQILHLASYKSHFIGRLIADKCKVKTVIHLHDSLKMPYWIKIAQRSMAQRTDLAVAVSSYIKKYGVQEYGLDADKITVLYNAIDCSAFNFSHPGYREALCQELKIDVQKRLIVIIGRLSKMKGQDHAIRAMEILGKTYHGAALLIVGEGPLHTKLELMAKRLNLQDIVRFTGQRSDIPKLLSAIDLVAMPSMFGEGFPFVAIEAIASGKPVVAYDVAGIPEVVLHNKCGFIVPVGDVQGLADGMLHLLSDPNTYHRLSQGGLKHAKKYALRDHVSKLISLYKSLV